MAERTYKDVTLVFSNEAMELPPVLFQQTPYGTCHTIAAGNQVEAVQVLLAAARTALSALEAQEDKSHDTHPAAQALREAIALAQESK